MYASAYPWGWMPYRYGNWMFIPGFGWMWQPGGWNNWLTVPRYTGTGVVHVHPLVAPAGTVSTVVVGKGGPASVLPSSRVVVNSGSAGLGIPRGSFGSLSHLNNQVAKNGSVVLHPGAPFSASSGRTSSFGGPQHNSMSPSSAGHSSSGGHSSGGTHH